MPVSNASHAHLRLLRCSRAHASLREPFATRRCAVRTRLGFSQACASMVEMRDVLQFGLVFLVCQLLDACYKVVVAS